MLYYFDIQNFYTLQKVQNHTVYLHHVTRATVTMVTFRQKILCDLTGAGLNRFGHGVRFGIARTEGWKKLGFSKKGLKKILKVFLGFKGFFRFFCMKTEHESTT